MLKDVTLGQYFPGNSPIHLLDPRTKLIWLILYIVALFTAAAWVSYGVVFVVLATVIWISKIPLKSILRGMKPLVFILIFTGILNLLFTGGEKVLVSFWKITITLEGLERAFFMVIRILMLITGTFLLTYTTSPIALTDGLESLMSPLKKLHLPVHELSMMMCIALFISAFRRADELATAMECRCYQGGEGRTKMKLLRYKLRDIKAFVAGALLLAAVIILRNFGM